MTVKVTYTCDRCLSAQDTNVQFLTVGIKAQCSNYTSDQYVSSNFKMEVCRTCLEDMGIHTSTKQKVNSTYPSLEELIREIVERCK